MSQARSSMRHRCTIQRDANHGGGTDPYGGDAAASWAALHTSLACRYWFSAARTVIDGKLQTEIKTRMMLVPTGTDVTEDDRVLSVTDRLGNEIADGPMRIDSVGRREGHIVLTMVEVR